VQGVNVPVYLRQKTYNTSSGGTFDSVGTYDMLISTDTTAPSLSGTLAATTGTTGTIQLSGVTATDAVGVDHFTIEYVHPPVMAPHKM